MAQLSRPYQIGLIAVAVLAAAWLLLLQGHSSSSPGTSSSSAVSSTSSAGASAASPSSTSSSGHLASPSGPTAPGISGLTRAAQKAQGAVATSEQNAKNLQHNSEAASSPTGTSRQPGSSSAGGTSSSSKASSSHAASSATAPATPAKAAGPAAAAPKTASAPEVAPKTSTAPSALKPATPQATHGAATRSTVDQRQLAVEGQLHRGKIVLILFWDRKGTDDRLVHSAVQSLSHGSSKLAVETATPHEVASFGSITRGVQVYGTPTLLVVDAKGHVTTLTGLQDAYGIRQAISETQHA